MSGSELHVLWAERFDLASEGAGAEAIAGSSKLGRDATQQCDHTPALHRSPGFLAYTIRVPKAAISKQARNESTSQTRRSSS